MKKWKCTVCDFIVEGEEPLDICPVCGAPKSAFVEIETAAQRIDLKKVLRSLHLHPISAHFQNGLFPVCLLFLSIFYFTGNISFESSTFYVYAVAVMTLPLTFAAGILDWYLRYDRVAARIFTEKIILSIVALFIAVPVMAIRLFFPDVLFSSSPLQWVYLGGIAIQTGIVTRLGYLGGKLMFS